VLGTRRVIPLPESLIDASRIGTDEHLVGIEPLTCRWVHGPVDAIGVVDPWSTPADEHMPEMKCLVLKGIQSNDLGGFICRRVIEEQKYHFGGRFREE